MAWRPSIRVRHESELVTPVQTVPDVFLTQTKKCMKCQNTINEHDSCYLTWEFMYFCDIVCLHWYQKLNLKDICSYCSKNLPEGAKGKYVFRYDTLLQFCSITCFHENLKIRSFCIYCIGRVTSTKYNVNGQLYCSEDCVFKHRRVQGVSFLFEPRTACYICRSEVHPITIYYQAEEAVRSICTNFCLQTLVFSDAIKPVECSTCKVLFTPNSSTLKLFYGNREHTFCSTKCRTFYVFSNQCIYTCESCGIKRFDTDLIKRCSKVEALSYVCSVECYLKKYSDDASMIREVLQHPGIPLGSDSHDAQTNINGKIAVSPPAVTGHVVVNCRPVPRQQNIATMCYVQKTNKSCIAKPVMIDIAVQTDNTLVRSNVFIPVPFPMYLPSPVPVYSSPYSVPFLAPIPLPVPILIPATRRGYNNIFNDIQRMLGTQGQHDVPQSSVKLVELPDVVTLDDYSDLNVGLAPTEGAVNELFTDDVFKNAIGSNASNRSAGTSSSINQSVLATNVGIHAWRQWAKLTLHPIRENEDILSCSPRKLGKYLAIFISEIRRPNGDKYAPDTLFYLCLSIQKYLFENSRRDHIFFDNAYKAFIEDLNKHLEIFPLLFMKTPYIITRIEEEHLWDSKQLGNHSPYVLLNTILYNNMKYFKLKTVEENMSLGLSAIVKAMSKTKTVLRYYRNDNSYNEMEENTVDADRCPVKLFELYCSKLPTPGFQMIGMCYKEPKPNCGTQDLNWYTFIPLQRHNYELMINRLLVVKELNVS